MSRDLMDESYYISHGGMIPVKWTAPEVNVTWLHLSFPLVLHAWGWGLGTYSSVESEPSSGIRFVGIWEIFLRGYA